VSQNSFDTSLNSELDLAYFLIYLLDSGYRRCYATSALLLAVRCLPTFQVQASLDDLEILRDKFSIHWCTAGVDRRASEDKTFSGIGIISCSGCSFGFARRVSIVLHMALKVFLNLFKLIFFKVKYTKGGQSRLG
jgi:hypothetical protein